MRFKTVYPNSRHEKVRYFIDGKEVSEKEFKTQSTRGWVDGGSGPVALMQTSKSWPRKSNSLGCHATQKAAFEEQAAKLGVPTEYALDGTGGCQVVFRDNAHQRDFYKAMKRHNKQGGYGQITG